MKFDPESLWETHSKSKIIQIYGKSGSGKSTLAMHFAKFILESRHGKLLWIDTEKKTTTKRVHQIIGAQSSKNFLIAQPTTYYAQEKTFQAILSIAIPISAVVVDTISHHFRYRGQNESWNSYSEHLQYFYEQYILPLLVFQEKSDSYLILIHQVTSVPEIGDKPFLYKVYEEIKSSWIRLSI